MRHYVLQSVCPEDILGFEMEIVSLIQLVLLMGLLAASALLFFRLRDARRLLDKRNENAKTKA